MARTVAIGKQDYGSLIEQGYFYVDKTNFIKEWWGNGDDVTLITRPRRFGKTLTMSMVNYFFSVDHAGRTDLFEGLDIWKEEKYRKLQGTCPVIFLSFSGIKDSVYEDAYTGICQVLADVYAKNDFLLNSGKLNAAQKRYFLSVTDDMSERTAIAALNRLTGFLAKYYGKKVILLLDEYDTPMQEAYLNGYWDKMASLIRKLFNSAFKSNPYLDRAIMTGITRVSKESVFSDLNNLEVVTTTSEKYETVFGFTEKEVFQVLEEYGLAGREQEIKKWYDGFAFGTCTNIYNPWSVTNFLDKKKLFPYWANTSSNSLAGRLIREGSPKIKQDFEVLLQGGCLEKKMDEQIIFSRLDADEEAVWSLLLAAGYLKVAGYTDTGSLRQYRFALTNKEVSDMFEDLVQDWFSRERACYNGFIKALLADDVRSMNRYMNKVALTTFSYFDTGNRPSQEAEPERFYHVFVLGLIVELSGRYLVSSNRESGFGRYDVMLIPAERKDAGIIMEFKVYDGALEDSLEDTAANALKQIEEKKYAASMASCGIPEDRIRKYGFAFKGKTVLIGRGAVCP